MEASKSRKVGKAATVAMAAGVKSQKDLAKLQEIRDKVADVELSPLIKSLSIIVIIKLAINIY